VYRIQKRKILLLRSCVSSLTQCTEWSADAIAPTHRPLHKAQHQRSDSSMSKMSNLSFEIRTRLKDDIFHNLNLIWVWATLESRIDRVDRFVGVRLKVAQPWVKNECAGVVTETL
jgi:hypothetical protein